MITKLHLDPTIRLRDIQMVGYFPDTCSYRTYDEMLCARAILRISIHNRGDRISCDEVERDGLLRTGFQFL